jgi:riboflavin kinase/FMN adenylyltransferase
MHETVSSTKIRQAIKEGYIQKANAYLDHYYLVMGHPERYQYRNNFYEINLAKVPLTEECKLLPLPGVYAVSLKTANTKSKGMAIINVIHEGEQEVLINVIEGEPLKYGTEVIGLFHKRIQGPINLADQTDSARWLKAARNEVSELVF